MSNVDVAVDVDVLYVVTHTTNNIQQFNKHVTGNSLNHMKILCCYVGLSL